MSQEELERLARLGSQIIDLCAGYTYEEIAEVLEVVGAAFKAGELGIAEAMNREFYEDPIVKRDTEKLLRKIAKKQ